MNSISQWQVELLNAVRSLISCGELSMHRFHVKVPISLELISVYRIGNVIHIKSGTGRYDIRIHDTDIEVVALSTANNILLSTLFPLLEVSDDGERLYIPKGTIVIRDSGYNAESLPDGIEVRSHGCVVQAPYWRSGSPDYIFDMIMDRLPFGQYVFIRAGWGPYIQLPGYGKLYKEPDLVGTFFD